MMALTRATSRVSSKTPSNLVLSKESLSSDRTSASTGRGGGPSRRRSPRGLYRLACATGGEYLFLARPDEFVNNPDLAPIVASRIFGAWKLTAGSPDTAQLNAGRYLLSTDLSLALGGKSVTIPLTQGVDPLAADSRLWLVK